MTDLPDIFSITDLRVIICSYLDFKSIIDLHLYLKKEINYDIIRNIKDNTKWNLYRCNTQSCYNLFMVKCKVCYHNVCYDHLIKCKKCNKTHCVNCVYKCTKCNRTYCGDCVHKCKYKDNLI